MSENKEIQDIALEELVAKQKSLTNWKKIFLGLLVLSVVMTLYAIYRGNIGKHAFYILGCFLLVAINSNRLKKVEEEINKRKA